MSTDLDTTLAAMKPTPTWTQHEREAVLDRVLAGERTPNRTDLHVVVARPRRRRTVVVAALAGLAAAAAIALPTVLPSGSPGSAPSAQAVVQLHHLARIAAHSPADTLRPDQFWHYVSTERQTPTPGQPAVASRFEFWTSPDGHTWLKRQVDTAGPTPDEDEVWLLRPGSHDLIYPSPRFLATLPTDPDALEAYLRTHTSGSSSPDEEVFVAVRDLLGGGLAPPALRSAAIEMLARLGHVELGDVTRGEDGPVQEFVFHDPSTRPDEDQSLLFDTRTAQIVGERDYFHGRVHFRGSVSEAGAVDEVPPAVRAAAVPQD